MKKIGAVFLLASALLLTLPGCFPVVAVGVAAGGLVSATDRRTVGTQTEDETIEWKALSRAREQLGDRAHLNFTSFNRRLLVSGEAESEEIRKQAGRIAAGVANVASVYNEAVVGPFSSLPSRSNDAFITSKIKSRSLDSQNFNPIHIKVVTEGQVAFLLGIVTPEEARAAIEVARTTAGVKKVVNLFEVVAFEKIKAIEQQAARSHSSRNAAPPDHSVRSPSSSSEGDQTDGTP